MKTIRERRLESVLRALLDEYKQLCEDHHVMGFPYLVRSAEKLLNKDEPTPED